MTIKQFLNKHVEGYLYKDLRTIKKIKLPKNQKIGGVGYPMITSILAGMELLGVLLQKSTFDIYGGSKSFYRYWDEYLSVYNPQYKQYGRAFRMLVRDGVTHTFLTKPGIVIVKSNSKDHLSVFQHLGYYYMIIDLEELYKDLISSYESLVRPVVFENLPAKVTKQDMQDRLDEMVRAYEKQSREELSKIKVTHSHVPSYFETLISTASTVQGTVVMHGGTS